MTYSPQRALQLLRIGAGRPDALFRDGQEEAIRNIVDGMGRWLVVQKTGWGKSPSYPVRTQPATARRKMTFPSGKGGDATSSGLDPRRCAPIFAGRSP